MNLGAMSEGFASISDYVACLTTLQSGRSIKVQCVKPSEASLRQFVEHWEGYKVVYAFTYTLQLSEARHHRSLVSLDTAPDTDLQHPPRCLRLK